MGALEFMNFFYGVFIMNFLGLWIWLLGLRIWFAGSFIVDWKMRKSRFELWFCIFGFCGLRKSEKICCWVYVCVLAGDRFVFVFGWQERAWKCKKPGHVFLCLKYGFVFFGVLVFDESLVLVEDEHGSKLMYFWILIFLNLLKT